MHNLHTLLGLVFCLPSLGKAQHKLFESSSDEDPFVWSFNKVKGGGACVWDYCLKLLKNFVSHLAMWSKITKYLQRYILKYIFANILTLSLCHMLPSAFYQSVKGFFSQVMQGALGLRPCCPAAQMSWKYPPNTHEYPP